VLRFPNNLYAQWRLESGAVPLLREGSESPPEQLLQAVWQHQRLQRDQLTCLDGQPVRILHPGFVNRESGPDFRGAIVQFGQELPRSGDIEVDVQAGGWIAHGHHRNPAFRNVILRVVWAGDRCASGAPAVLVIQNKLDAPIGEMALWLNAETEPAWPELLRGRCCGVLRQLSSGQRDRLLRDAAQVRFRSKAAQIHCRAREAGWEQALWEGLFRALGYKQNSWPMCCLAEQRPRWLSSPASVLELQARLLGIANLLPVELTRSRAGADDYLRRVWDFWWRERAEFADCILPVGLWRLRGQRPANQPQRRLALAAHWLAAGDLVSRIERWCALEVPETQLPRSLMDVLQAPLDPFWSWHWTLRSARLKKAQPLLGPGRVTDLAVNVILPWLWIRAAEGKNETVRRGIERRFEQWPAAEDNSVLRLARQRLLGGAPSRVFQLAVEQQGCIQICRDFCDRTDSLCANCRFPDWAREVASDE
jgi:Protein of unknown function (DUF2851)